jgi:4'-phosphopantetheinyl transferase EntD
VIEKLLPPGAVGVEVFEDLPGLWLFPEEEGQVLRVVESRRREFTTGRHCARAALTRLGYAPVPVLGGARGAPRWPAGVVGSITHCAGYRAAAVARVADLATMGIDAEPNEPLPAGVLHAVTVQQERDSLGELATADPGIAWDRLLFSAKESVYKAWFPLTGEFLDFDGAVVGFDPALSTFAARLTGPGPTVSGVTWHGFAGRFAVKGNLVVTVVAHPLRAGHAGQLDSHGSRAATGAPRGPDHQASGVRPR